MTIEDLLEKINEGIKEGVFDRQNQVYISGSGTWKIIKKDSESIITLSS